MAIPSVNITGTVRAPNNTTHKGTITISLIPSSGAATVNDDTTTDKYKLDGKPIVAKILATGDVKGEDGASTLKLVPNTLISPQTTYYKAVYRVTTSEGKFKWQEIWYLDNKDVQIGEIQPVGTLNDLSTASQTIDKWAD